MTGLRPSSSTHGPSPADRGSPDERSSPDTATLAGDTKSVHPTAPLPCASSARGGPSVHCTIVPPYLLARLARASATHEAAAAAARRTLERDQATRHRREVVAERVTRRPPGAFGVVAPSLLERAPRPSTARVTPSPETTATAKAEVGPRRAIHDAEGGTDLPGELVRAEGARPVADAPVNQAYDGLGATWSTLWEAYGRNSLDGKGLKLTATVHYDRDYDNAFWDGTQMVFGDGDGITFRGFTSAVDVIGHELAHGLIQYTAGLIYVAQTGALNESVSDVFGVLVKQYHLGQAADDADWLIGAGLFTDRVNGKALRSMAAPGTAYDDPVLGRDPQPADMDGYVEQPHDAEHDNGGVHINSGIPNRAFHLCATALGGYAWERAGQIWYDTLTAPGVPRDVQFSGFAALTVAAAAKRYGPTSEETDAVRTAWDTVKVPLATGQ